MAPESVVSVINKYTDHHAYVFGYQYGNVMKRKADVLHSHNRDLIDFSKKIIQYHSEPFRVDLRTKIQKCVIAQYHATLPEYANIPLVRNPIDFYEDVYLPKYIDNVVRIGYSPSNTKVLSKWADKGYKETKPIIEAIKRKFKDKVEIDIITNVPLEECLERKSRCNIFIDEVKTKSYHRSSLESLSMGITTVCSIGDDVQQLLKDNYDCEVPVINYNLNNLEEGLEYLVELGPQKLNEMGQSNRVWAENNWDPKTIANEYIKLYESL